MEDHKGADEGVCRPLERRLGGCIIVENISGYARVLARATVKQNQTKPFLGKAYLKFGQCLHLWCYSLSVGGVLGAKHSGSLDALGTALLGARGEPGAVERFFIELAKHMLDRSFGRPTFLLDFITADQMKRFNYAGDEVGFFQEYGMVRVKPETASEVAYQYTEIGAALGAVHPKEFRKMLEQFYNGAPDENWERARAAGLDIPQVQDRLSYKEVEDEADKIFMAYCRECCPDLHAVLND